VSPFNFSVHYPEDGTGRILRDDWLSGYHVFHENPVILMEDDAWIKVEGKKTILERGEAWILRKKGEKEKLTAGIPVEA
jgi:hypothetical protein